MENRVEISHGTEIPRRSRSLDVKSLYRSRSTREAENQSLKRNGSEGDGDGDGEKKKKSRKEVSLSSLKNVNSSSSSSWKNIDKEYNRGLVSGSHDLEALKSGSSQNLDSGSRLNSVSQLSLDNSGIQIPRRKRGFVGRKKLEGGQALKLSDESAGKASIADQDHQVAKLSGEELDSQAEGWKAERNKGLDECKENLDSELNGALHAKKENALESQSVVSNGNSSLKKSRRKSRKSKDLSSDSRTDAKKAEPLVNSSTKACQASHEDEEENLEENAAMMLSSRFDPSCTGFSLNTKACAMQSSNGLSGQDFDGHMSKSLSGSESPSVDNASRTLRPRPRKHHKEKKGTRKRRHFYEIFFGDLDACWVVNRRIKVFWPLDQSWYYGLVNDYDKDKKLHHIRYDDREEEWIDLQHERFKLLLLPTEVPGKAKQKKSFIRITGSEEREENLKPRKEKKKRDLMSEDDSCIGSCMDSEPIISWLARSTRRIKSPSHAVKKQKTSGLSPKSVPTLSNSAGTHGCLGDVSSRRDTSKSSSNSGRSSDALREEKPAPEGDIHPEDSRMPVVYYRKRLRKTGSVLSQIYKDEHASMYGHRCCTSVTPVEEIWDLEEPDDHVVILDRSWPLWYSDGAGLLKLTLPWVESGKVIFKCLQLHSLINDSLGAELLRFFHAVILLRHGIVVITWPKVHLEMLFVDNVVGLRFLLFEGCLKQAVVLVFLILTLFHQPNDQGELTDFQLPATSIRFKFSCVQHLGKELVFAFYNFCRVKNSKWMHLDNKLGRHCLLTKKLPLSECTYDNILALQNGINQSPCITLYGQPSSVKATQKRSRQGINFMGGSREVGFVNISHSATHSDEIHRKLPPFALSFTAAPTFFINLHLKLLMEHSVANICLQDRDSEVTPENNLKASENVATSGGPCTKLVTEASLSICSHRGRLKSSQLYQNCVVNVAGASSRTSAGRDKADTSSRSIVNGLTVDIPPFDQSEKFVEREIQSAEQPTDFSLNMNGSIIPSPSPTAPRSTGQRNRNSMSSFGNLSHCWSDGKADIFHNGFGNGPKKPRTQVSYTLPCGGSDGSSKQRNVHKGLPNKRIRRASEKRSLDTSRGSQRNLELLTCEANVLITASDRGWRENGARVALEQFDNSEWKLAVKLSGTTKYLYKAHQFLQPGSTNRYTHVMMWKGGKDWFLEFPDRSQWALFKEMHEECYNRNLRSSVKNIPIPGVRLVEDIDDNGTEIGFLRSSTKYFQQMKTDVEMALDPSRILYDMDSDDERWISKFRNSSEMDKSGSTEIGEEMFEKTMDMFEKAAYVQQCDQFTSEEIEEFMTGLGPMDLLKTIYEHWRQKRVRKGMPLIRHLQPPSWEIYQKQVREWEQVMTKMNTTLANGGREKAAPVEKPPMYAFCLKPRGLEVPNKGSKQRSQKKYSISAHTNAVLGDQDGFHSIGRRSNGFAFGDEKFAYSGHNYESLDDSPLSQSSPRVFSPRDAANLMSNDAYERNHLHRMDRSKSKKYRTIASPVDPQIVSPYSLSPYSHRVVQNRNGVHRGNFGIPEWSSQSYYQPDVAQRLVNAQGFDHDEFRFREASSAAQYAHKIAKRKRENARRLFYRADLAMHKAVVALMTAEAIKASSEDYDYDYDSESDSFSVSDSETDSDSEE